ncbi:uncharacterized protein PAC_16925 [Phialocephala subalpina]|uniref:Rhodopsin domain-containing protein n=1 Tax=Phialocephala subalpina TaxID=576137 RepID=A0A1L7XPQ8_9HELO|nr:uncharacterized protein PAC_16925 [Phialocephala subalpina]
MDMNATLLNPDGPDITGPMMRTIWTLYGITLLVVVLRLYTQWRITRSLGLGDAMMFLSVLCATGTLTTLTIQKYYGLGRHFSYLSPHQKIQALKYNFIGQPLGIVSSSKPLTHSIIDNWLTGIMAPAFGRNATCILMLQLFGTTSKRRWFLWATFWQSLVVNSLTIILIFVQCKDVRTVWDPIGHPGFCWSPTVQEYTGFVQGGMSAHDAKTRDVADCGVAINSATDLFLTLLPIRIFYTLKISLHLKLGLSFLLGLSFFAFVASVIKTVELRSIGNRGDFTFGTVDFFTWVVVETTLVDIAASAPLIPPLFRRWRKEPPKNSYQLQQKLYGGHSIVIRGGRSNPSKNRSKSNVDDIGTTVHNSSEENILTLHDTEEARIDARPSSDFGNRERDLERGEGGGKERRGSSPIRDAKKSIIKQTSFDVSFKDNVGEGINPDGTRKRDEMWLAKELPKIPWEAYALEHEQRNSK